MRKVELLPTRDYEAGYGPDHKEHYSNNLSMLFISIFSKLSPQCGKTNTLESHASHVC